MLAGTPTFSQLLNVASYSTVDGLAASQVWQVFQDSRGYMWFATSGGISRYDGVSFTSFTAEHGLPSELTRTVVEDASGSLWFGTSTGVSRFDGRRFEHFGREGGVGRGVVWASTVDPFGHPWFGTQEGGATVFVDGVARTLTTADGLAENYVYALHVDRAGHMWLGHRNAGLSRCDLDAAGHLSACRRFGTADGLPHDSVRAIAEDAAGTLYFGTRGGGIASFDGARFTTWTKANGLVGDEIYALLVRRDGALVVGTLESGASICTLPGFTSCQAVTMANGLRVNNVFSAFEDREGNLWFGLNNGVSKLASDRFEGLTATEGLPTTGVHCVLSDRSGSVWVGTFAGLARVRTGPAGRRPYDIRTFSVADGLAANTVWDVLQDRRGRIWVGTANGLCRLVGEDRFEALTGAGMPVETYILELFEDSRGRLWLGTNRGLTVVEWPSATSVARVQSYSVSDGLAGGNVCAVTEDRSGRIWIGTIGYGLSIFDGTAFRNYATATTFASNEIFALTTARDGTVWIGSVGGGLVRARPGAGDLPPRFERFGNDLGLGGLDVRTVLEDDDGSLWLGTSKGVWQVDPAARDGRGAVVRKLDTSSGLIGNETRTGNAFAKDSAGTYWFGLDNGLTRFDPRRDDRPAVAPRATIERVTAGSGATWLVPFSGPPPPGAGPLAWLDDGTLELPADDNNLRFDYRGLSFASERDVAFQVQLEGFDAGWSDPTAAPYKEYTNLNPGRYTFRVRACSRQGSWVSGVAGLELRIRTPYWRRWWFMTLAAAFACLALAALHRARVHRVDQRARELETLVDVRTEELRQYSQALEDHARKLEQANRHKSDFLAAMSHELRTPLNSIIGFSEVLLTRLDGVIDPRLGGFLRNIHSSGHHLLGLINNLLDLAKVEAGKMGVYVEDAALGELAEEVRAVITGMAHKRSIEIQVRAAEDLPVVRVDVAKIKQILFNLLSNAVKFSPDGSTVVVDVRPTPPERRALTVPSFEISVTDQGVGISEQDQRSIFEEFYQVGAPARPHGGTGLGLTIVRQFVKLLSGSLTVESSPGQGSTFRVELPTDMGPPPG